MASFYYLQTTEWHIEPEHTTEFELAPITEDIQASIDGLLSGQICADETKFAVIYELLQQQYVHNEDLDLERMKENAVKGFVDAIGDPYTSYMTVDENKVFDEEMHGSVEFE
ncbi:MAG: hypothetical protein H6765_07470 [Candidatus Peribacteria bacterium]|nr:MAG: hypothetical protein H6765_07470 [Candidatus Peribacteria bacterium]